MSRATRRGRSRRVRQAVHRPSATSAGAHTHGRRLIAGSPGLSRAVTAPLTKRAAAGTYAHVCGRLVYRVVSEANEAQPAANATSAPPTTRASDADVSTTKV